MGSVVVVEGLEALGLKDGSVCVGAFAMIRVRVCVVFFVRYFSLVILNIFFKT